MMSMAAVRWLHPADDWAIAVEVNDDDRLEVSVYNFATTEREFKGKTFRLGLGEYQSMLTCEGMTPSSSGYELGSERVAGIRIPPQSLCRWSLTPNR